VLVKWAVNWRDWDIRW